MRKKKEEAKERRPLSEFTLPEYREIPDVGLYLEQTSKYVTDCLDSIKDSEITGSMISNYVKHGIIPKTQKKLYYRDQIAYLLFISLTKNVISLDDARFMFSVLEEKSSCEKAYAYFATRFVRMLHSVYLGEDISSSEEDAPEKELLSRVITASVYSICSNDAIEKLKKDRTE